MRMTQQILLYEENKTKHEILNRSYCWFSASRHIKIKIKTVQQIKYRISAGKRKKVNMQTLAKIQVKAVFLKRDMRRNFLPKFIKILHGDAMLVLIQARLPAAVREMSPRSSPWQTRHERAAEVEPSAHPDGHQLGGWKSTETSVTEFCCKSVNLSLEELKNIKMIVFLIHELLRQPN